MTDTFIQNIRFDERGLIPAIVQDARSRAILKLCYLDNASLISTLQTGQVSSLSGSEISDGHSLIDIRLNPDGSSITVLVESESQSPEPRPVSLLRDIEDSRTASSAIALVDVGSMEFGITLDRLYRLIADRKDKRPEGSYTTYLFNSGLDKILKKIAEESGEVIIASKNDSSRHLVSELADLFYHLIVLMIERGVRLGEIDSELSNRAAKAPRKQDES
jgi:phosphoribosyl-ATP pyrophosphohydrolase/phosphoribosyl-AMP cyclohydrolase